MAVTRQEKLLNSVANGVPSDITPITREEQYLSYIGGGSSSYPTEPITRKEVLLKQIAENGVSGGGGVTIKNQNKTITENGTYKADSGYTGLGTVVVDVATSGGGGDDSALIGLIERTATELVVPEGTTKIAQLAFYKNTKLERLVIPTGVLYIDVEAFSGCTGLKEIKFENDNQLQLKRQAFSGCSKVENIIFKGIYTPNILSSDHSSSHYVFYNLGMNTENGTTVTIGNKVTSINSYLFRYSSVSTNATQNNKITKLIFEDGSVCSSIGSETFGYSGYLTEVTFPESIETIGYQSFTNCTALASVTFKGTPNTIHNQAFNYCNALVDIYVPWAEGEVANAPWGATNATIHYNSEV